MTIIRLLGLDSQPKLNFLTALQDGHEGQLLMLVSGTICLSGVVQLSGEDCSLFSESFVLCPTQSGPHYIKHQIFKVHKQNEDAM